MKILKRYLPLFLIAFFQLPAVFAQSEMEIQQFLSRCNEKITEFESKALISSYKAKSKGRKIKSAGFIKNESLLLNYKLKAFKGGLKRETTILSRRVGSKKVKVLRYVKANDQLHFVELVELADNGAGKVYVAKKEALIGGHVYRRVNYRADGSIEAMKSEVAFNR